MAPSQDLRFFQDKGYFFTPKLVPEEVLAGALKGIEQVKEGIYETGEPPQMEWHHGDEEEAVPGAYNPHVSNSGIQACACHPVLGQWVAELMDAEWVQVWSTFATIKERTAAPTTIGWHYDSPYWQELWANPEECFGVWIALADVVEEDGAMRFVEGSHRWPMGPGEGLLFERLKDDLGTLQELVPMPEGEIWREVVVELEAGQASLHHSSLLHGSPPNRSGRPRRGLSVWMRTDRARVSSPRMASRFEGPKACPKIYRT